MNNIIELLGKHVEVSANQITYHGTLVEVSETDVFLQGDSGWVVIPVDQVISIRGLGE
jgi:hypothetical protein